MLAITTQGSASQPPLVLLHGFLGSSYDWHELLPHLSQDYYCIAVDLPGHGRSCDIQIESPGFSDCVALLRHTLLKAGIPRFHLVGYSLGGRIALHLAQTWPEALLSLHLESCHPGLLSNDERRLRAMADKQWAERFNTMPIEQVLALWYQQAVFADLSSAEREGLIEKRCHQRPLGLINCYQATSLALQQDLRQVPAQLACPSHYYLGELDGKFGALAKAWQPQGGFKLHTIADAGHNSHQAQPGAFATALKGALNAISRGE